MFPLPSVRLKNHEDSSPGHNAGRTRHPETSPDRRERPLFLGAVHVQFSTVRLRTGGSRRI